MIAFWSVWLVFCLLEAIINTLRVKDDMYYAPFAIVWSILTAWCACKVLECIWA